VLQARLQRRPELRMKLISVLVLLGLCRDASSLESSALRGTSTRLLEQEQDKRVLRYLTSEEAQRYLDGYDDCCVCKEPSSSSSSSGSGGEVECTCDSSCVLSGSSSSSSKGTHHRAPPIFAYDA
jgi:hypothetical protein